MFSVSYQRPVDSKFTGPKPSCYTTAGGNVGGYHNKRHPKPNTIVELQKTLHLRQPASGTDLQSCKKFPKWPKASFKAKGRYFEHSQWTLETWPFVAVVWITLFTKELIGRAVCYLLCICSNVFECAKIARWQRCNGENLKIVYDN